MASKVDRGFIRIPGSLTYFRVGVVDGSSLQLANGTRIERRLYDLADSDSDRSGLQH
jgi:hypothetical protein